MELARAHGHAERIGVELHTACDQLEIAGSIRRKEPNVKDIEFVAVSAPGVPAVDFGMTGKRIPRSRLEERINALLASGFWILDPIKREDGPKYKRFVHRESNLAVDLFITTADQFGIILAIRTGDAKFSKQLVTSREKGGLLTPGWRFKDGRLLDDKGNAVPVPTERRLFDLLGLPFVNPRDRGLTTAQQLYRDHKAEQSRSQLF